MIRVQHELKSKKREAVYLRFGAAVAAQRVKLGMTQVELSGVLNRGRSYVALVEGGFQRVKLADLFAFAEALQINPVVLLRQTQEPKPK